MDSKHYEKLRELLVENSTWPLLYLFKFIVPNTDNRVNKVVKLLPTEGEISYKHTENLKYVSVTCKVLMESAESIIEVTHQVSQISGVIIL